MIHFYILITEEFRTLNEGTSKDGLVFASRLALDGNYYASTNSLNEFPELFNGTETIVRLTVDDFPQSLRGE
jgi:hypothetical protein